ncbi:MAG TPA: efflux transporter outer membrane subunit [Caulobacterales bacterium]|nr:efflux transporter outer membrane subunit [Caulobacterales bacterium]
MVRFRQVNANLASPKPLAGLLAALALASCASLPDDRAAASARSPDSFAAARSFQANEAAWPTQDWWRAYGDPQLTALIEEGLQGSPTLAQAEARLRAASAARDAARADAGPNISANANIVEEKQSYNFGIPAAFVPQGYNDYGRAALDFSYELDFWGRNRAAISAATSDERAAAAEAAQARLTLSTAIAQAYADLARLTQERAIAAQSLDVRTQTVSLVTRRVQSGLDTRGEQRQAEAAPSAARAQIAALDEAIAQTRNQLAALVGAGPDRGLDITPPQHIALHAFGLPANLSADLIGRRPDVVAARWRAEAATARIHGAEASFYPNVNLAAFVGVQSLGLNNLTQSGSDIGSIGPALSLPIFDSGRLQANLRRADAEHDAAIAAYDAALTEALHQVADVAAGERALSTRLSESRAALNAYEDAYRIARLRYEGGLSNYQAVLIAEDAVLAQRLTVADLESRAFTLDVALVRALGGGFTAS